MTDHNEIRLYGEFASWWPLVSAPADYAEEAAFFQALFAEYTEEPVRTVLELGSGGGNNASFLKAQYQMTLTDRSSAMLAVSQELNPECEHIQGDMRSLRLGRTFDAVFIHDAIGYMTSERDLRRALETAYVHCRPGGLALFVPDHVRETFADNTDHHGHDGEGRALRYLEWTFDPDPADSSYVMALSFLFREADGTLTAALEQHKLGLFGLEEWLRLLEEVGFRPTAVRDNYERFLFLGKKER
jgi:SAM-dependent methyltransferase